MRSGSLSELNVLESNVYMKQICHLYLKKWWLGWKKVKYDLLAYKKITFSLHVLNVQHFSNATSTIISSNTDYMSLRFVLPRISHIQKKNFNLKLLILM